MLSGQAYRRKCFLPSGNDGHCSTSVSAHNASKILERTHKRHELHLCTRTARVGRPTMDWKRIPNSTVTTIRAVTTLSTGEEFWCCLMAAESGFTCPQTLKSIIKNGDLQRAAALNVVLPCQLFVLPCEQPQQLGTSPQFRARRRGRLSSAQGVCPSRRCYMQKASSLRCTSVTLVI